MSYQLLPPGSAPQYAFSHPQQVLPNGGGGVSMSAAQFQFFSQLQMQMQMQMQMQQQQQQQQQQQNKATPNQPSPGLVAMPFVGQGTPANMATMSAASLANGMAMTEIQVIMPEGRLAGAKGSKRSASSSEGDVDESSGAESSGSGKRDGGSKKRAKPRTVKPRPRSKALISSGWDSMTYADMIKQAILSASDQKMLLCDIYSYLAKNFDCFSKHGESWKNSVRHNLSIHKQFKVVPIDSERESQLLLEGKIKKGSAGLWTVLDSDEASEPKAPTKRAATQTNGSPKTKQPQQPQQQEAVETTTTTTTTSSRHKRKASPVLERSLPVSPALGSTDKSSSPKMLPLQGDSPLAKKLGGTASDASESAEEDEDELFEESEESETAEILLHLSK
jgi:hypothetical protein